MEAGRMQMSRSVPESCKRGRIGFPVEEAVETRHKCRDLRRRASEQRHRGPEFHFVHRSKNLSRGPALRSEDKTGAAKEALQWLAKKITKAYMTA